MKRVFALLVVLGLLIVPGLVRADDETIIPPEANWSATPPTPPLVAVEQPRTVSTPQGRSDVRSRTVTVPMRSSADDETIIPQEANWTSTPATPSVVAVPERREVVTPQAQESGRPSPGRTTAPSSFAAFQDGPLSQVADDSE